MLDKDERPEVLLFGETRDRTVLILFPADILREMVEGGVLRDFPPFRSEGTRYSASRQVFGIQYRFPLPLLARLERAILPYVRMRWERESSDMNNPQENRMTSNTNASPQEGDRLDLR